jgi:hypothetical protein
LHPGHFDSASVFDGTEDEDLFAMTLPFQLSICMSLLNGICYRFDVSIDILLSDC